MQPDACLSPSLTYNYEPSGSHVCSDLDLSSHSRGPTQTPAGELTLRGGGNKGYRDIFINRVTMLGETCATNGDNWNGGTHPFSPRGPPVELTRPALRRVEASRNKGNKKLVGSLALSVGRSVGCARVFAWDLHEEKILANQNRARTVCNALSSRRFDGKPVSSCQDSVLPCNRRRVKVPCTIP